MAIIVVGSAKGGCGKTTNAILIASELALAYGYKVALLDCDVNQHSTAFVTKAGIQDLKVVPDVSDSTLLPELRKAEAKYDVVIVDLQGGTSKLSLMAIQRADFVIIPCKMALPDLKDSFKTMSQVEEAEEMTGRAIARALLWSEVDTGFESEDSRHVRKTVEAKNVPLFQTAMMKRTAFRRLHITGQVPRQMGSKGKTAAINVAAVTAELMGQLEKLTVTEAA